MYKPRTVEQFKVMEYIKREFQTESLMIAPVSRSALMVEDMLGEKIAFQWQDNTVVEIPVPQPAPQEVHLAFVRNLQANHNRPQLSNWDELTDWWLNHPTPITHQQLLALSDALYRRYLTCDRRLELEDVLELVMRGCMSATEYMDVQLWYLDGNYAGNWLGPVSITGTEDKYELVLHWLTAAELRYPFCIKENQMQ